MKYILAIDQGTSSTKAIVFDEEGRPCAKGSEPLKAIYLDNGLVEQNPQEIIQNVRTAVGKCLEDFKTKEGDLNDIKCCGISNQRETFVVWDEHGVPLCNAVVWQCKRSIEICKRWISAGFAEMIKSKTGLLIDPYFSGSKLLWLYENNSAVQQAIDAGRAYFGTVDSWLLFKLTEGNSYFTDYTNASRTLFFNIKNLAWDKELLKEFGLSKLNLPHPKASSGYFGFTNCFGLLPSPIEINAVIGDSHAAAFGEGCFKPGSAKATLGTGCSILMNIGEQPKESGQGMVTTICWSTEDSVQYALEGVIISCGSTIEWLKNELGLFTELIQTGAMASSLEDNGGVYLVPAFSGLGAPHWKMDRKASITGLTFGTQKHHIVRAALESIPYQIKDVIVAMESDTGIDLRQLMVDGGMTGNFFVLQYLADLINRPVVNIGQADVSALGAAYLAGLKSNIYESLDQLSTFNRDKKIFQPSFNQSMANAYEGWKRAILNIS